MISYIKFLFSNIFILFSIITGLWLLNKRKNISIKDEIIEKKISDNIAKTREEIEKVKAHEERSKANILKSKKIYKDVKSRIQKLGDKNEDIDELLNSYNSVRLRSKANK